MARGLENSIKAGRGCSPADPVVQVEHSLLVGCRSTLQPQVEIPLRNGASVLGQYQATIGIPRFRICQDAVVDREYRELQGLSKATIRLHPAAPSVVSRQL